MAEVVKITLDGREVEAEAGELLIAAAEKAGTYIPRFCWHARMDPVGMCRMCLVEVEGPRGRMLTTSCTTPVGEGMVVHTASETVKKAQEGVLEFLLINHPLDCPVCDKGGECPLQDQTMSHGPGESRYVEEKRHFEKPIPINDLVLLDRERCILCARCTRFADEIAGDPLIEFIDRGNHTQVNTFPDDPFASYFSGNTVQLCPVGALTAKPFRFKARPWDLEAAESTCTTCAVGCRVSVQASHNEVVRIIGVDVDATNQGWLCDRGRFGFEHLRSPSRLDTPMVRRDGELVPASWPEALEAAAAGLGATIAEHGPGSVAGIGGARSTNEEAYAFSRLLRSVIGTGSLDASLGDDPSADFLLGVTPRAVIADLEQARTVLVWGPDLKEELPVLHLRVRRAATALGATLIVVAPGATGLDPDADHVLRYRPGEGPALLQSLAAGEGDLSAVRSALDSGPVVAVIGRTGVTDTRELPDAVARFVVGLADARVLPVARRGNLFGALDMGISPGLLPGRRRAEDAAALESQASAWGSPVAGPGRNASEILAGMSDGSVRALLLLGSDPAGDHPERLLATSAFSSGAFVVSFDMFLNDSNRNAAVVFPVDGFAEVEGTVTNFEGRVQKVNRVAPGVGASRPAVEALADLAERLGGAIPASAALLAKEITQCVPGYSRVSWESLDWGEGRDGVVIEESLPGYEPAAAKATDPGALALHSARRLYSGGTTMIAGPSLAPLLADPTVAMHPDDADRLGLASGDRATVKSGGVTITAPVEIDSGLPQGTVFVPLTPATALGTDPAVSVTAGDPS